MITSGDLRDEISKLELKATEKGTNDEPVLLKAILKGICLLLKLVVGIRSNQVKDLENKGIKFRKATPKKDTKA